LLRRKISPNSFYAFYLSKGLIIINAKLGEFILCDLPLHKINFLFYVQIAHILQHDCAQYITFKVQGDYCVESNPFSKLPSPTEQTLNDKILSDCLEGGGRGQRCSARMDFTCTCVRFSLPRMASKEHNNISCARRAEKCTVYPFTATSLKYCLASSVVFYGLRTVDYTGSSKTPYRPL
jgi:hypothetical protein